MITSPIYDNDDIADEQFDYDQDAGIDNAIMEEQYAEREQDATDVSEQDAADIGLTQDPETGADVILADDQPKKQRSRKPKNDQSQRTGSEYIVAAESAIRYDGKRREPGETVLIFDEHAEQMLAVGLIKKV